MKPFALLFLLALSGCALASIPVPAELSSAPKLSVGGRQGFQLGQRIRFGAYATDRVRRGSTDVDETHGIVSSTGEHRQGYSFRLMADSAEVARVGCYTEAVARATSLPAGIEMSGVSRAALECDILPPDADTGGWTLTLAARNGRTLGGALEAKDDGGRFDVEGTTAGGCCEATGYYLRRQGRAVAAVEVINAGGVWLDPALTPNERHALAAAATALLLRQELGESYTREP
ncbi:MAG TPA: hypothetical protein VHG91_02175 [Longimicrobium sp.]|nr:hypothetical protein [Longimicrobium sp.]